jgi:UDP-N-acetylglucosamine--N-acetylmuramyl-(pentapeptide) pyrophosphoryl-undecaprenol N-acetylglucosamine transferase
MPAAVARLLGILGSGVALRVLHQAGAKNVEETRAAYASAGVAATEVEVVPFLDDVAGAMAASHLLVSRAGAITVAEICAASRAALFLPLTIAQAHQVDNARLLADAGAAELLTGEAATPDALAERLGALLGDGPRLARMGRAARGLARPGAVAAIADRLTELAERRVGR